MQNGLPERRRHPRIQCPMPLKVKGKSFEFDIIVKDLSAGGLSSRSSKEICVGENLRFVVEFSVAPSRPDVMPRISAGGIVTRVRNLNDGSYEFAAKFTQYRFL